MRSLSLVSPLAVAAHHEGTAIVVFACARGAAEKFVSQLSQPIEILGLKKLLPKLRTVRQPGGIPRQKFLQGQEGAVPLLFLEGELEVAADQRQQIARLLTAQDLLEDPRILQSTSTDHHRVRIPVGDS